jgi:hypothetical protein
VYFDVRGRANRFFSLSLWERAGVRVLTAAKRNVSGFGSYAMRPHPNPLPEGEGKKSQRADLAHKQHNQNRAANDQAISNEDSGRMRTQKTQ